MSSSGTPHFIGREIFLQDIDAMLQRERRGAITGPGGVGKTAVAHEYVRRFSHHYGSVFWLNAATEATFLADLFAAMQALSLAPDAEQGFSGLVQTLTASLADRRDALFVLDNFSHPFMLQDMADQQHIYLLMIIGSLRTSSAMASLELTGLNEQEGALLVLRRAGVLTEHDTLDQVAEEQRTAALELARELRGLPLSLDLAGGYLNATGSTIQDYLAAFRDYSPRLSRPARADERELQEMAIACECSCSALEQLQPSALEQLHICALFAPEALPRALFQQGTESEQKQAKAAVQIILNLGLMVEGENARLNMHPQVQEIVRELYAEHEQQRVEQALRLLHRFLPSHINAPPLLSHNPSLGEQEKGEITPTPPLTTRLYMAEHVQHLMMLNEEWTPFFNEAAEVCSWAASVFWKQHMPVPAEALLRRALLIWERTLGAIHPLVAANVANLAILNNLLKNYAEAETLFQRAITSKAAALGAGHPDVLLMLNYLGHCYAEQGKQEEARQCYEKAVAIGDQVHLRAHPVYLTCLYDLALLSIAQEQFEKAEPWLLRVCMAWERSPGPQDPSTMDAWFKLADVAERLQHWRQAEVSYQHALPVCEQLLGEEDPITLGHLQRAAVVFLRRGKLDEAKRNFQRVLTTSEHTVNVGQFDIMVCLSSLAQIALAQEQVFEAHALLERAQNSYTNLPAADKLALAKLLDTMAAVEMARQHYDQAIEHYKQALDLRTQILGEEHLDRVESLTGLATLYLKLKQPHQAEVLFLQALYIYQQKQKPEDLVLDPALNGLAEIEIGRKHFDMARMYLERSSAIRRHALGQDNPQTVEVLQKLAEVSQG